MAEQRPIVIIDGEVQELPVGDTLPDDAVTLNVDGGFANSVYLAAQLIDGGSASG